MNSSLHLYKYIGERENRRGEIFYYLGGSSPHLKQHRSINCPF